MKVVLFNMLNFRYLHNNTYRRFKPASVQKVGVRTRSNEIEYVNWLGLIERSHAIEIADKCVPVKLVIDSYRFNSEKLENEWIELENGVFIQGCFIPYLKGVFLVVEEGRPRLVSQKYSMAGAHSGKY